MSAIAVEPPGQRDVGSVWRAAARALLFVAVLAAFWGLWEGYRALWIHDAWTWPFAVDSSTMPHLHDVIRAFFKRYSSDPGSPIAEQGGSGITQQLVKNLLLSPEKTLRRKLSEAYMSIILETRLNKELMEKRARLLEELKEIIAKQERVRAQTEIGRRSNKDLEKDQKKVSDATEAEQVSRLVEHQLVPFLGGKAVAAEDLLDASQRLVIPAVAIQEVVPDPLQAKARLAAFGDLFGDFTTERADFTLQVAHAGFACVVTSDAA